MKDCKQDTNSGITSTRSSRRFHIKRALPHRLPIPRTHVPLMFSSCATRSKFEARTKGPKKLDVETQEKKEKKLGSCQFHRTRIYTQEERHRYLAHRRVSKLCLARESEFLPRVCTLQEENDRGSDEGKGVERVERVMGAERG